MPAGVWIQNVTFSDGTLVSFQDNEIIVLVGPNNAGKSAALAAILGMLEDPKHKRRVLTALQPGVKGSMEDLLGWLEATSYVYPREGTPGFAMYAWNVDGAQAKVWWQNYNTLGLNNLTRFFCRHLTTSSRLESVKPPESISLTSSAPKHPIHYLQRDDQIEKRVSGYFREAFGCDIIVHHNSGKDVPLYMGVRPQINPGEDRLSSRYLRELEKLPKLHEQGDGVRSFAGVLLHAIIGHHTLTLLDEPEAFLHPPQARLLGRMLATENPNTRQLFIATHSTEVLQGLLDANQGNVRVVRITRHDNVNRIRGLNTSDVKTLWCDPLLRHSNVLSGLFHEKVVVCESDADCRFYAAILDTLYEDALLQRRDIMFVHCGGKARIPTVAKALRAVGVPVCAVADFDVLNDEAQLRSVVESLGGNWSEVEKDFKRVKTSIESKKPELSSAEVKKEIEQILTGIGDGSFPREASKKIDSILRRSSPWDSAKVFGKDYVPRGDPYNSCTRLLAAFAKVGLFVPEVGEQEGFARSVGGHGPKWVIGVLPKVLARDLELQAARDFVKSIVSGGA